MDFSTNSTGDPVAWEGKHRLRGIGEVRIKVVVPFRRRRDMGDVLNTFLDINFCIFRFPATFNLYQFPYQYEFTKFY